MSTKTGHFGVRFNEKQKDMEDFVDKRMKQLKLNRKQFFVHLLQLDGYNIQPTDV